MRYFPQNITKFSKVRQYDSSCFESPLENISFEMGLFIYVLWANKCQEKILKILPLPSQEPFVFTVSCRLRDGESLLVWLLEVNLSVCRKHAPLLPSNE